MFTGEGTFADWSAAVLKKIESDPPVLALAEKYYQALSSHLTLGGINPTEIIVAYKRTLAQFMMNYGAFITPSIFALDRRGQAPEDLRDAAKIAESRLIGLDEDHEFAPLPEDFREQHPEIYKIFEANFQHYKETLIEPLYRQLGQCDTLLILIDIPGLLASNVGRFNDTAAIISYVLEATTKHSNNWWKRLIRLSKTKNIGFIATKADLINYADKSQTNALVNLMDELLMPAINQYPIENKLFTCAAIKSTHEHEEETIQGYPVYTATGEITPEPDPDMDMSLLYPSKLPTEWPGSWTYGKYFFPEVWPILHERRNAALDHNNLDVITEYILGNDRV
jgi:predicted YcjX-like family ATPase